MEKPFCCIGVKLFTHLGKVSRHMIVGEDRNTVAIPGWKECWVWLLGSVSPMAPCTPRTVPGFLETLGGSVALNFTEDSRSRQNGKKYLPLGKDLQLLLTHTHTHKTSVCEVSLLCFSLMPLLSFILFN